MLTENQLVYERYRLYHLMQDHPDWSFRAYARELGHDPKWVLTWAARRIHPLICPTLPVTLGSLVVRRAVSQL